MDFMNKDDEYKYLQLCEDLFSLAEDFNREGYTEETLLIKDVFKDIVTKLNSNQQIELQESMDSRGL
jgi:hypothetical protein